MRNTQRSQKIAFFFLFLGGIDFWSEGTISATIDASSQASFGLPVTVGSALNSGFYDGG